MASRSRFSFQSVLRISVGVLGLLACAAVGHAVMTNDTGFLKSTADTGYVLAHVDVRGLERTNRKDVDTVLQIEDGMPILAIDLAALKDRVESLPWVDEAIVDRRLPSDLVIAVTERTPIALWQIKGEVFVIDSKGISVAPGSLKGFEGLPLVVGAGANREAAALVASLSSLIGLPAVVKNAVRVSERRWDIHFSSGLVVKLPDDVEDILALDTAWQRLRTLHDEYQILSREVATIDLRQEDRLVLSLTERGHRSLAGKEWET